MTRSEQLREQWKNPEYREKMSKQSKNLWKDENYKEKVLEYLQGDECRKLSSERFKGKKKSEATKLKMQENNVYNKLIKINGIEYISIKEASRCLNIKSHLIRTRLVSKNYLEYEYLDGTDVSKFADKNVNAMRYRENHPEKSKEYYAKTKDHQKEYRKLNSEKIKKYHREYNEKNKESIRITKRLCEYKRRKTDKLYNLRVRIRGLIAESLRRKGYTKKSRTFEILGCSYVEFMHHLESQFEPWMTWENYGKYNGTYNFGWNIDHIIPNSSGNTEEEILKLNHYTNLQPLCSKINRDIKRNKRDYYESLCNTVQNI
jgi:hypothetical protein